MKKLNKISLDQKFRLFQSVWDPHAISQLNGQQIKLVRCTGVGDLAKHEEDVLFLVFRGTLIVAVKDQKVELEPGELLLVPNGTSYKLAALRGAEVLILDRESSTEPANLNGSKIRIKKI